MLESCSCAIDADGLDAMPVSLREQVSVLNIPIAQGDTNYDFLLYWQDDTLVLHKKDGEKLFARLDRPAQLSAKQPFTRALAPARGGTILEATGGLGGDTLKLALVADHVIAVERHPMVYAMLVAALFKAREEGWPAAQRVDTLFGDAISLVPDLPQADVIYIDPMFPPKRKRSALPPKSVRILRDLVGDDPDDKALLDVSRQHAGQRVVVKQPLHASTLASDPVAMHEGKVVRYEVYLPNRK